MPAIMQESTRNIRMNKAKKLILHRFPKFVAGNVLGTLVDTLVLWVFSHLVFHRYVGKVIISPIISFEFAVFTNRISHQSGKTFIKHYGAYNASCTAGFLIKMGLLLLIQALTKWDVVICNLLALCVSGAYNFTMNELVIFKKRKVE